MAMARRTNKVGTAGRFGTRYGVRVRKRVKDIERVQKNRHECPSCHHRSVRRVSTGIWECARCEMKYAAMAYTPISKRSVTGQEVKR